MIVADTNVVSELMRAAPEPAVVAWVRAQPAGQLVTTAVTIAEIGYGIERLPSGRRQDELRRLASEVFSAFVDEVLGFDVLAAAEYGRIVSSRDQAGAPINGFDAQIASICRVHDAGLATRNLRDFEGTGIEVVDPWIRGA